MYQQFFGLAELPFSIVPNSRYLYLSQRHQEAISHLQEGLGDGGGFAMLTGEVGTGKTTVAKAILDNLPANTQAGFILNPTFSEQELLEAICDEFSVSYGKKATLKKLSQALNQFLLEKHADGIQVLLIIDEAQHLAPDVLEQLRLLTNLETDSRKLLKVLLIGQPELQQKLQLPQLRQLAQRITGRYHLLPLDEVETAHYIRFRLQQAGGDGNLFSNKCAKWIARETHGIPRLINLVCDNSLKGAFKAGEKELGLERVKWACQQVMSFQSTVYQRSDAKPSSPRFPFVAVTCSLIGLSLAAASTYWLPPIINEQVAHYWPVPEAKTALQETVFPKQVEDALIQAENLSTALRALYAVWGYKASVIDTFCQSDSSSLLQCMPSQGDWQTLSQLNMPVVLTLEVDNKPSYAVLYRLNGDELELLVNDEHIRIDKQWISPLWNGEFHLTWQASFKQTLKSGMKGQEIALLDRKLSQILGEPERETQVFDDEVKRKVSLFQRWQNMHVDGIAGEQTLRRLELLTQQDAPKLDAPKLGSLHLVGGA
ncbi:ExeA family protein [Vibrio diazotrophicus]|uniref:ExeA family protein n=1 Tax=Vibrio diazotrophicus TaxID=685 RepID=UPI000C9E0F95|nr:ExeA family protein [Vibrio diazotrophicus]PNH81732.1 general secretion pathway protein GspA [Vibrio diazotrophicus]